MSTKIFVNLAVKDLERSKRFFEKLGFGFNPQFTDPTAACMVIADDIYAMLLTREKFREFTRKELADATKATEVLTCLSAESREHVDRLVDAALAAGASEAREPMSHEGFMYHRSFHDLDGHVWEIMWMDPAVVQQPEEKPGDRELVLTRVIDAPPAAVYRAWTEPELLVQWFAPRPWTTSHVEVDLRPGGRNVFVMRSPQGEDFPNVGVYLEVVPNRRIVVTDAFTEAWVPAAKPFMTLEVTLDDLGGGKTRYTARVLHPTVSDRVRHEQMGFHEGWGQCAEQLAEVAAKL